jgi:hypothetical protein
MKKFLVGAAAAAAILAPVAASADTNAVVGVQYANNEFDSFDFDSYGFNAALSHDFDSTFLQFDGEFNRVDADGCCNTSGYGAMHYGVRNDSYAFAGVVSLNDFFGYSGLGYGVEGAMYFSNFVVNGALGQVDFSDLDFQTTTIAADASYFFTPNFAVNGLISHSEGEDGIDADWTTYGVGGEWRFSGPTSVTFGYRTTEIEDQDSDAWTIGLNFDLGTGSLQERATSGPGMSGGRALSGGLTAIVP